MKYQPRSIPLSGVVPVGEEVGAREQSPARMVPSRRNKVKSNPPFMTTTIKSLFAQLKCLLMSAIYKKRVSDYGLKRLVHSLL